MTVREVLARVGADELTTWQAYDRVEGLPDRRAAVEAAGIAHTVWAMLRGKGGGDRKLADFVITFDRPERQGPEQMAAALMGITAAAGGTIEG